MNSQVLAIKWRPQIFKEVAGQQHILTALSNSLSIGRIHHAYLFSGTRGVGKTTIARILAKCFNCINNITPNPCRICHNCKDIESGRFIDLIEIDAASKTKVEDTRELLDNIQYTASIGRFKVYLIDEIHMLSRYSFNALLKTLEEPPKHVKFIFATTDPQKIPITILSRCLHFNLRCLSFNQIMQKLQYILQKENIQVELSALQLIANAANGSMRDALSLTDQAIIIGNGAIDRNNVSIMLGDFDNEYPLKFIELVIDKNINSIIMLLNEMDLRGINWDNLLIKILHVLHRIAILQNLTKNIKYESTINEMELNIYNDIKIKKLANRITHQKTQIYYQIILMGRKDLSLAPNPRIGVEMTLLRALNVNFHDSIYNFEKSLLIPKISTNSSIETISTETEEFSLKQRKSDLSSDAQKILQRCVNFSKKK